MAKALGTTREEEYKTDLYKVAAVSSQPLSSAYGHSRREYVSIMPS